MIDRCGTCGCDLNTLLLAGLTLHAAWCTPLRKQNGIIIRLRACLRELWPHCEAYGCDELATVEGERSEFNHGPHRPSHPTYVRLCDGHASRFKEPESVHRGPNDAKGANRSEWAVRRLSGVDELTEG